MQVYPRFSLCFELFIWYVCTLCVYVKLLAYVTLPVKCGLFVESCFVFILHLFSILLYWKLIMMMLCVQSLIKRLSFIIFIVTFFFYTCNADISRVDDKDLMHLLTHEENLVVVFTKSNCAACEALETVAEKAEKQFKEYLSAVLVKNVDSQLLPIYNPNLEQSLIYFRKGIPLLYYGDLDIEQILLTFSENKEPAVKELTDENFEFLTQASTGSTTGDWFIFFTANDCHLCHRLYAVWEAVGSKVKHRVNVARMNRLEYGTATAKRFGVTKSPAFIYIRHGKYYVYKKTEYTPKKFIEFAEGQFMNEAAKEVPPIGGVMNDYIEKYLQMAWEHKEYIKYATFAVTGISMLTLLFKFIFGRKAKPVKKTNNKKKN